jgi:hypothetical protein
MIKKLTISLIGSFCSVGGIIGIIYSNAITEIFLFVITAILGLFTLAISGQDKIILN